MNYEEEQQQANEDGCKLFGHMPEYAYGYDSEGNVETQAICGRCGIKL